MIQSTFYTFELILGWIIKPVIILNYIRQRKKREAESLPTQFKANIVSGALGKSQGVVNEMSLNAQHQQSQFTSAQALKQIGQAQQIPQLPPAKQQSLAIPPVAKTVQPKMNPQKTPEFAAVQSAPQPQLVQSSGVVLPPELKSLELVTSPGIASEQQTAKEDIDDGESKG